MAFEWPEAMGVPILDGYELIDDSNVLEQKMSVGPDRRTLTSAEYKYMGVCHFVWTTAQLTQWNVFIWLNPNGINRGTIPIRNFPLDLGNGTVGQYGYVKSPRMEVIMQGELYKVSLDFAITTHNWASP